MLEKSIISDLTYFYIFIIPVSKIVLLQFDWLLFIVSIKLQEVRLSPDISSARFTYFLLLYRTYKPICVVHIVLCDELRVNKLQYWIAKWFLKLWFLDAEDQITISNGWPLSKSELVCAFKLIERG